MGGGVKPCPLTTLPIVQGGGQLVRCSPSPPAPGGFPLELASWIAAAPLQREGEKMRWGGAPSLAVATSQGANGLDGPTANQRDDLGPSGPRNALSALAVSEKPILPLR